MTRSYVVLGTLPGRPKEVSNTLLKLNQVGRVLYKKSVRALNISAIATLSLIPLCRNHAGRSELAAPCIPMGKFQVRQLNNCVYPIGLVKQTKGMKKKKEEIVEFEAGERNSVMNDETIVEKSPKRRMKSFVATISPDVETLMTFSPN